MFKLHIFLLLIIARTYTLGNPIGSGDNNAIQQKNLRFITDNKGVQYYPQEKGTFFAKLGLELPVVNGKTPIAKSSWNHIRSRRLLTGKYPTGKPNGFWFILSPRRGNSNKQILVLDIQILWLPNPASRRMQDFFYGSTRAIFLEATATALPAQSRFSLISPLAPIAMANGGPTLLRLPFKFFQIREFLVDKYATKLAQQNAQALPPSSQPPPSQKRPATDPPEDVPDPKKQNVQGADTSATASGLVTPPGTPSTKAVNPGNLSK